MGSDDVNTALSSNTEQPHEQQSISTPPSTSAIEVTVLSLNVCGLKSKLQVQEFCSMCILHDLLIFCETKCDDLDVPDVTSIFSDLGFHVFIQNRESFAKHRSGGVLVAIRKSLSNFFHQIPYAHNFLTVLRAPCNLLNRTKDLVIIGAYIPPYGSRYSSADMFHVLSNVLLDFDPSAHDVLLVGDLNAHTLLKDDLVELEEDLFCALDLDLNYAVSESLQTKQTFRDLGLTLDRYNTDLKPDNGGYGETLIELCRNHSMAIFNGRVGTDKFIGQPTTTDGSMIDYVIGSPYLLVKTSDFIINSFDPLFSDKHCAIQFTVGLGSIDNCVIPEQVEPTRENLTGSEDFVIGKWSSEKSNDFVMNLDLPKINAILANADNMSIDNLVSEIKGSLLQCAESTLGRRKKPRATTPKRAVYRAPKYTLSDEAKQSRKAYHKAKRTNNLLKTTNTKLDLIEKSKLYRKEIRKAKQAHKRKVTSDIRNWKSGNSRKFWDFLNSSKKEPPPISLQELLEHFKEVSTGAKDTFAPNLVCDPVTFLQQGLNTDQLNNPFTEAEVKEHISRLKNGKASGCDDIINEYIKHSATHLMPLNLYLFNRILNEGQVPQEWLTGMIIPLYKGKGDRTDCNNYRGITLLSCFGKLFTALLNSRLYNFCEENEILKEMQTGFRSGYSTTDHIFLLQGLVDLYCNKKKKLYAAFVDYAKAFDTVSREALWYKLTKYGVNGKMLQVVRSLYSGIKSCVFHNSCKSESFISLRGVRQGENLSPLLFSLFVNDLEDYFSASGCKPISVADSDVGNLIKVMVLMYADDTILLADSAAELQRALGVLHSYCQTWQLQVNCAKTKVVVFGKRKVDPAKFNFTYNGSRIDTLPTYKYLGLSISYNGSFKIGIQDLCKQASRAMYALLAKCRSLSLPLDIQLYLFDVLVAPILLYGCEVWGFKQFDCIEKLHLKFLKYVLGVRTSTCNSVVYGELGRYPLSITIKKRMISYWVRLYMGKESKLSRTMLDCLTQLQANRSFSSKWTAYVQSILDNCGRSNVWNSTTPICGKWLVKAVEQSLKDQFLQSWRQDLLSKSSCDFYVSFKDDFKLENYLLLPNVKLARALCRFRTGNNKLPLITGRYRSIPRHERHCTACDKHVVGDEYHLLIECANPVVVDARSKFLPRSLLRQSSVAKCATWIRHLSGRNTISLGKFLDKALYVFK